MDIVRTCYISGFRLWKGRPDIVVEGRYYRSPRNTEFYPGWTLYGSRDYLRGQWEAEGELGELKHYPDRRWNNGVAPFPTPIPKLIGKPECVALGETELPPPAIHFERGETTQEITVNDRATTIGIAWEAIPQAIRAGVAFGGSIEDVHTVEPVAAGVAFGGSIEDVHTVEPVTAGVAFGGSIEDVGSEYLALELIVDFLIPKEYEWTVHPIGTPNGGRYRLQVQAPDSSLHWLSWVDWDASVYDMSEELRILSSASFAFASGSLEFNNINGLINWDDVGSVWTLVDWESEVTHA